MYCISEWSKDGLRDWLIRLRLYVAGSDVLVLNLDKLILEVVCFINILFSKWGNEVWVIVFIGVLFVVIDYS